MFHPAYIFIALATLVILFQLALAAGVPWGAASMGGKFSGIYPPAMRFVALVNVFVILFTAIIVLSRAQLAFSGFSDFSRLGIWFVVGLFALATVMNTITPSKIERIWAPVALAQFICALLVALA